MDINEILKYIPHRYPFLLVDRILSADNTKIIGLKNVSMNEPFFQGHFPGHPIMPGVLQLEAIAQVGGLLMLKHAFETWRCVRVTLKTDERNARSRAAIERLGARLDGVLRAHQLGSDGKPRNTAYYTILALH